MAIAVSCALAGTAAAQPGADVPPPPRPPPPPSDAPPASDPRVPEATPSVPEATPRVLEATPPAALDPRSDAGWQLYHEAFGALLAGNRRRAGELAATLQREHAGHPAAQLSARADLGVAPGVTDTETVPGELPTRGARAELALFQTIHGVALGVELCIAADCDAGEAFLGVALLGGTAGLGASLAVDRLTSGQRALLNGGTFWGAANAGLTLLVTQPDNERLYPVVLMAGQLGGLGLGAALTPLKPTSGQVGLASSGGQWGAALAGLSLLALEPDASERTFGGVMLAAMDIGLAVGAQLAVKYPRVSRAQTFVIDAGGIVGGVSGAGIGVLVGGDADTRATPGLAAIGALVGLGVTTYLTRHWDDR
jgi:hypothetical protein